jgi:hypothetical protein
MRNIGTAISRMFSNSKPGEFTARSAIETALAATKRETATKPVAEPTVISKKGVQIGSIFSEEGLGHNYHKYLERETLRHSRYVMYDRMDTDLIASAIDVYANEATQKNQDGQVVGVFSSSKYIQDELRSMLEDTGINNYRSWSIIRNMCKYGDHFVALKLDSVRGIVALKDLNAISVYRLEEKDGQLLGYVQDLDVLKSAVQNASITSATMNPYINLNTLSLPYLTGDNVNREDENSLITFLKYELIHFRLRGKGSFLPYGASVLESSVDVWKKLDLLFDSLIIYRLNRAPTRLVFYVDIGNNQGADADQAVRKQINALTKKEYFNANGKLNERYQLLDMNANLFIPMQKGSSSKVEQLAGVSDVGSIEDVTFLNNRLFSALKVPKSFLGYEGDVSSKGMLSQQNVTFSKAIQNIQEDFLEAIKDMCLIHLAIRGISDLKQLKSFDLVMTRPSYVEEKARLEVDSSLLALADSYKSFGVNTLWIAKNILRRTENEVKEMFKPDPLAQQGMPGGVGGGMPAGGGMPLGGDMGMTPDTGLGAMPPEGQMAPDQSMAPMPGTAQSAPMPAPMPAGGPAPDLGGASLTAGRRYLGDLIIETTDVIKPVKHYGVELNEIKILVEKNGFESQESEARTLTSLTEEKKLQLTEPEEIFDGEN